MHCKTREIGHFQGYFSIILICGGYLLKITSKRFVGIPRRGRSREGRCANLSQIARQICGKIAGKRRFHRKRDPNVGSARGPFTVKKRPLFDENAL